MAPDAYDRTRERVTDFVRPDPDEIAPIESTTAGINVVANAADWQPVDTVGHPCAAHTERYQIPPDGVNTQSEGDLRLE